MSDPGAPKVSIGLPVYNGAEHLAGAIESILGQTFDDFELVISDNASTDDTARICEDFAARDERVRYSRNSENMGAQFNFNRVFELSRGEYFKWASHDDWMSPRFLEHCVAEAETDPSIVLVYGRMCRVDAQLGTRVIIIDPAPIVRSSSAAKRFHDALWHLPYYPIFGLFRRSALRDIDALPNLPEPDRIVLAEVALRGRCGQVPLATLFQRSPERKDTWVWLNPSNVRRPLVNTVQSTRALASLVTESPRLTAAEKAVLLPDVLAFQLVRRVKGKVRQYHRRLRWRYGTGSVLEPGDVDRVVNKLIEQERGTA